MTDWAEAVEHIRRRPGMYLGGTGPSGRLHMVMEIASNSFDQVLAGLADHITVSVERDGTVAVSDNGCGISVQPEPDGRSFLERVFTEHRTTPTADGHRPHVHIGLGGLGVGPICALSESMVVRTSDGSATYEQTFARGFPTTSLEPVTPSEEHLGTTVRFRPDREIFGSDPLPLGKLEAELTTLTDLVPGVTLTFLVEQSYGPSTDVRHLHESTWPGRHGLPEHPILLDYSSPTGRAVVALTFAKGGWQTEPRIRSFCNYFETSEGGTHVSGVEEGLQRAFGMPVPEVLKQSSVLLHVTLDDPTFVGPTRGKLDSPEAVELVADAIATQLPALLASEPDLVEELRILGGVLPG